MVTVMNSFVMPAIYDSLVHSQHLTPHKAWRVAFIVPFILITVTAITILLVCPDTPTGKWSERGVAVQKNPAHHVSYIVDVPGPTTDKLAIIPELSTERDEKLPKLDRKSHGSFDPGAQLSSGEMVDLARDEV